jgi:hypothetical protein
VSRTLDSRLHILGAAMFVALPAAGCATSETSVIAHAPEVRPRVEHIRIVPGAHTAGVRLDDVARFEDELRDRLYGKNVFAEGGDMTVEYSFLAYDRGTQVKGLVFGVDADKPGMTVLVRYLRPNGAELSKITVGGHVSLGAYRDAARRAADQAADYTIAQFLACPGQRRSDCDERKGR